MTFKHVHEYTLSSSIDKKEKQSAGRSSKQQKMSLVK